MFQGHSIQGSSKDHLACRIDPARGGEAGKAHQAAIIEWEAIHLATATGDDTDVQDRVHFTREILPLLQDFPPSHMAMASALTEGYCSLVRRGLKVPHWRHWQPHQKLSRVSDRT